IRRHRGRIRPPAIHRQSVKSNCARISDLACFLLELAFLQQQSALLQDEIALLSEVPLDRTGEFLIGDVVHAGRRLRLEAAELLEAPAGARLEAVQPLAAAVPDPRVITKVGMSK